jgi:class 3 adenylate cyclase
MPGKMQSTLIKSLTNHIQQSQREVTILFTDIEESTRYWGNRGNLKGRLMVDRHNRILLPIVRQFHGRVVKTIGDAVMALFTKPEHALSAAIAMQQALQQERENDRQFGIHVRMGLHIGEAIVERDDVYGDVVNVAARIENEAEADEILISGRLARRLDKQQFKRSKKGGFTPKGKHRRIALYRCHWQHHEDLLQKVKLRPLTPLGLGQSIEMVAYLLTIIATFYFIHLNYLRYLLADNETLALLFLNPGTMLMRYWYLTLLGTLLAASLLWRAMRINAVPTRALKALKGGAAGGLLFMLLYLTSWLVPQGDPLGFNRSLYSSHHLIVELRQDNTAIREAPNSSAGILLQLEAGTLLLLSDIRRIDKTVWNKVLVDKGRYGWVERVQHARLGAAERRISWAEKFTLRYGDLYLLLLVLPAVVWGYRSFHVRPQ